MVVLIPPPVEPGEAPDPHQQKGHHQGRQRQAAVSTVLKPAVRVVAKERRHQFTPAAVIRQAVVVFQHIKSHRRTEKQQQQAGVDHDPGIGADSRFR